MPCWLTQFDLRFQVLQEAVTKDVLFLLCSLEIKLFSYINRNNISYNKAVWWTIWALPFALMCSSSTGWGAVTDAEQTNQCDSSCYKSLVVCVQRHWEICGYADVCQGHPCSSVWSPASCQKQCTLTAVLLTLSFQQLWVILDKSLGCLLLNALLP